MVMVLPRGVPKEKKQNTPAHHAEKTDKPEMLVPSIFETGRGSFFLSLTRQSHPFDEKILTRLLNFSYLDICIHRL